ncbi:hypothetical protein G9P44_003887 [Scheffersomyces stipitis]|nr:hypothetical protein G9P44_003887 [Scheffersomyces stipitis]
MLDFNCNWEQGWVLTSLSTALCFVGCLVIYLDDLYYLLLPRFITSRYTFKLNENYVFLNGSLAFSAGCLLFTSLFRLLPEALKYLKDSFDDDNHVIHDPSVMKWIQTDLIGAYIGGIFICLAFNGILHLATSESVVHCNHSGDHTVNELDPRGSNHVHGHDHSHSQNTIDLEIGKTGCKNGCSNSHTYERPDSSSDSHSSHSHTHQAHEQNHHNENHIQTNSETHQEMSENSPLLTRNSKSRKSLLHYLVPNSDCTICVGECKGFGSAELCLYHTQNETESPQLHFCEIPELTSNSIHGVGGDRALSLHNSVTQDSHISHQHYDIYSENQVHEDHTSHVEDHHHHITSPMSRLLLIGIQTTLAITLHKFPEGFITFITSETNPKLGVSIFLSLLVHNFTEGFSMCLPLYYSFASGSSAQYAKLKAVGISGVLGGFSQPLGAFLGYLFLSYNKAKYGDGNVIDVEKLDFIFGITMALTSGFLTVIALSMYGSAVSFGGSSNFVMLWCVCGITVIGVSSIFSA